MKLTILSERSVLGAGLVGSGTLEQNLASALGPAMLKKTRPLVGRLPDEQSKMLPYRSGSQDPPMKSRHRRFFNAPAPGTEKRIGYPPEDEIIDDDLAGEDPLDVLGDEEDTIRGSDANMKVR
jgi:hypothetical protein